MEEGSNKGTDITEGISTRECRVSWQISQQAQLTRSREKAEKETNESKRPIMQVMPHVRPLKEPTMACPHF